MKLVLASSSPRRLELLTSIGIIPDQVISPAIDESPLKQENVRAYVDRMARLKAQAVHRTDLDAYVLSADTVVEIGSKIVLKAETREEALSILRRLSGRRHRVYTAVCVMSPEGKEACRTVLTRVSFKRLSTEELNHFLDSGEWMGRAGAYSIQGTFAKFVKFISGSYTNVVGLPLYETDNLLKGLGFRG
jgi:septum formation protein